MDPNFNFQINLSGVQASGGGKRLEEGYYKGTIVDVNAAQNSTGSMRLVFKIGNFEGYGNAVRTTSITVPNENTKPGLLTIWRAAFESAGYTPAQIDSGVINMTREVFINRPAHVYYKPGDRDAGIYDEMKILSPSAWQSQKASFEGNTANNGSALGGAAPAQTAPAIGGIGGGATVQQAAPVNNGMAGLTPNQLIAQLGQAK
jgi:hypothetical protein